MSEVRNEIESAASSVKWMGILSIIFGVLAIMMPYVTGRSVLLLVGILVMAGGILRLMWAFRAGSLGKGILTFVIGLLTLLAGLWIITQPYIAAGALTLVLAIYFFVDGLAELFAAFSMPSGATGRGWLFFDGIVTIILGVLIFKGFPFSGPFAVGILLGIKLLFAGITMLTVGTAVKRAL